MKVLGVIAEFNPMHNGHHYLLKKAKEQCGADYTIVIMSGNFTQRGEPAIYDKFTRTHWALGCGADLVIEMPVVGATASARDFARTGIAQLLATGVITHLTFGCEYDKLSVLEIIADILLDEPASYKEYLKDSLKAGLSWPAARALALERVLSSPALAPSFRFSEAENQPWSQLLRQPNNILALEYLMALSRQEKKAAAQGSTQPSIIPVPIKRLGAGYHDADLNKEYCSATALRQHIFSGTPTEDYLNHVPPQIREDMKALQKNPGSALRCDDFSSMLIYRLLSLDAEALKTYLDADSDLAARIENNRNTFTAFSAFVNQLEHRAYTRTRIQRLLLHVLLGVKKSCADTMAALNYCPYLRVLGFRQEAKPLLSQIKSCHTAPFITRPQRAKALITHPGALELFSLDVAASEIYRAAQCIKTGSPIPHEYQRPLIRL